MGVARGGRQPADRARLSAGGEGPDEVIARLERATSRAREAAEALEERIREAHGVTRDFKAALRVWRLELASAIEAQIEGRCNNGIQEMSALLELRTTEAEVQLHQRMIEAQGGIVQVFERLIDELVGVRVGGLPGLERMVDRVDRLSSHAQGAAFAARFRASLAGLDAQAVTDARVSGDGLRDKTAPGGAPTPARGLDPTT